MNRICKISPYFKVTATLSIVFAIFLSLTVLTSPQKVIAQTSCDVSGLSPALTPNEQTLLNLINNHRTLNGLGALSPSITLRKAAAWMNNDMITNNRFDHTDSLGRDPGVRIRECGYNWTSYGENIFPNSSSPQVTFDAWKNSAPHNANMLDARFREVGIGSGGTYWTLDLGSSGAISNLTPTQIVSTITPTTTVTPSVAPSTRPSLSPTVTPTPSIILNPTNTTITVSIKIPGIGPGGNKSPKLLTRQVAIGIFDLNNKQVLSGNGYLKFNNRDMFVGVVQLGQLANTNYYIKVASNNTLVSKIVPEFQALSHEKPNTLPPVTLTQGDLLNDNVIDINDFNLALPCFQDKKCEQKNTIDLNDDGAADVIDYNLFLASFKRFEGD